jgi:uncharacterized protein (DUF3084 family)
MNDWNILVPILSGLATLGATVLVIVKAISTAPQDARSSDAATAKSYAEAARASADQCTELYERLKEREETIDRLEAEMEKRKEATVQRDKTIEIMQGHILKMEVKIASLETENNRLRECIEILEKENKELKEKINGKGE